MHSSIHSDRPPWSSGNGGSRHSSASSSWSGSGWGTGGQRELFAYFLPLPSSLKWICLQQAMPDILNNLDTYPFRGWLYGVMTLFFYLAMVKKVCTQKTAPTAWNRQSKACRLYGEVHQSTPSSKSPKNQLHAYQHALGDRHHSLVWDPTLTKKEIMTEARSAF